MHRLDLAREADLSFLMRVRWIDDEVDVLSILLAVKVEDLAIVDEDIRLDELRNSQLQRVRDNLTFGTHFLGDLLALALLGCKEITTGFLFGFNNEKWTLRLPGQPELLLNLHGELTIEGVALQENGFSAGVLFFQQFDLCLLLEILLCFCRIYTKQ